MPRLGVARRVTTAVLIASLTVSSVPTAAFADASMPAGADVAEGAVEDNSIGNAGTLDGDIEDSSIDEGSETTGAESSGSGAADTGAGKERVEDSASADAGAADVSAADSASAAESALGEQGATDLTGSAVPAPPSGRPGEQLAENAETVNVTTSLIGRDTQGNHEQWVAPTAIEVPAGATLGQASTVFFENSGLQFDGFEDGESFILDYVTSPLDPNNELWGGATGKWYPYVNGEPATDEFGVAKPGLTLKEGDTLVWAHVPYGADLPEIPTDPQPEVPQTFEVSVSVIGPDANGNTVSWAENATMEVENGALASEVTERLFKEADLEADYGTGEYGWYLNTITSPHTGEQLGWDQATGKYWQLFVNGKASELGAGNVELKQGDSVTWSYSAFGDDMPEALPIVPDPDASRPQWESAWPGYGSGSSSKAPTPTGEVQESWVSSIKDSADWATNVSDPIYVGAYVYVAAGAKLLQIDPATGATVREGALAAPIDSIARMVYADGVIIVPLSGGRLQALTADALTTVWVTAKLPANAQGGEQQSLSTPIVKDGCVYFGTAAADWSASYGGYLVCVDIKTGAVKWKTENADAGYYWAGAAAVGSLLVVGDDSGYVYAVDSQRGERVGEGLNLGARVRSTVVADPDGSSVYVVTVDGVLHKVRVGADGALSEAGKVQFASASTGTPALADGHLYVGGQIVQASSTAPGGQTRSGVLAVIDAETMQVEHSITSADGAPLENSNIVSAPVVSTQGGSTYVYFTANSLPGGAYRYRVGDATASLIYTPGEGKQNYCMGSIAVGPDGSLYYVNDSGALFAIAGVDDSGSGEPEQPEPEQPEPEKPEPENPEPENPDEKPGPDDPEGDGSHGLGDDGSGPGDGVSGDDGLESDKPKDDDPAGNGQKAPAGTAMVPGKKPVARVERVHENADEQAEKAAGKQAIESTSDTLKATASVGARGNGDERDEQSSTVRMLSVAGLVTGVVGLGLIGAWFVRARRRL